MKATIPSVTPMRLHPPHDKPFYILIRRMIADIVGAAHLLHLAIAQNDYILAQAQGLVDVVGNKNDGFLQTLLQGQQLIRSEEHTSELQSLMRISYAVFCLKKKKNKKSNNT